MAAAGRAEATGRVGFGASRSIGQRILALGASTAAETDQALAAFAEQRSDALLVNADAWFTAQRGLLVTIAGPNQ
jgi:hypothetical protein